MAEPAEDDRLLTAFLDGELPLDEMDGVAKRLASEPELTARLAALRTAGDILPSAFSVALSEAPRTNMSAKLALATKVAAPRRVHENWRAAAAAAVLAFLAGLAASHFFSRVGSPETESWRQSVAEYMSLYTSASFPTQDEATLRSELSALSKSVGVNLSPSDLRYGSFALRNGTLLQFEGAPLVQIGYVADGKPAAYCIIRNGEPDAAPTRTHLGDFNVVSWAKGGRGFMVLSAASADQLDAFAQSLREHTAVN